MVDVGAQASAGVYTQSPNLTGMSNHLKARIESLSGLDLSDVRVHANSAEPAICPAFLLSVMTPCTVAPRGIASHPFTVTSRITVKSRGVPSLALAYRFCARTSASMVAASVTQWPAEKFTAASTWP